jgi:hypothetical protein
MFFIFFYFDLEYLRRDQRSEPLHTKMPLIILLVGIPVCMATNRDLFPPTVLQKMRESQQLFLRLRLVSKESFRNPNQNRGELWRIFSSNKSAPANRKKGF